MSADLRFTCSLTEESLNVSDSLGKKLMNLYLFHFRFTKKSPFRHSCYVMFHFEKTIRQVFSQTCQQKSDVPSPKKPRRASRAASPQAFNEKNIDSNNIRGVARYCRFQKNRRRHSREAVKKKTKKKTRARSRTSAVTQATTGPFARPFRFCLQRADGGMPGMCLQVESLFSSVKR